MRRLPRLLAAAAVLATATLAPQPAVAAEWGLSDGRPAMLDAPEFTSINFRNARLVLPWNAGSVRGRWDQWLDRAQQLGYPVLISLNVDAASSCTGGTCTAPSTVAYRAELQTLLARYPVIDSVEPWNEPNHVMQPTRSNPALAAGFFNVAYDLCAGGRCTAVAGNMLDGDTLPSYFTGYRNALTRSPAAWGLHSYYDTTYFSSEWVDYLASKVTTPIWLTETGGLQRFQPAGGGGLERTQAETADSVEWLVSLASQKRVARVYYYGLWAEPNNGFDSALLEADGTKRLAYGVVADELGPRRTTGGGGSGSGSGSGSGAGSGAGGGSGSQGGSGGSAGSAGGSASAGGVVRARVIGKRVTVARGRAALVQVRCLGPATCSLRVRLRIGSWSSSRKLKVRAGRMGQVRVPVPAARQRQLRALGRPGHTVTVCGASGVASSCAAPVPLARATR